MILQRNKEKKEVAFSAASDPDPLRLSFSFPYDKNRLSMTIPAGVSAMLASHGSINGLILSHFLWTDNLRIRIRVDACSHTCP